MLEPWIIEEIRRREEEERRRIDRPQLELPVPEEWPEESPVEYDDHHEDEPKRGVAIIAL